MNAFSCASGRLPQDVVGDGELPDVVQLRGPLQPLELVTLKAQPPTDRDREGDDRLRMLGECRLALVEGLDERVVRSVAACVAVSLLGVQADVGEAKGLARIAGVDGEEDSPE